MFKVRFSRPTDCQPRVWLAVFCLRYLIINLGLLSTHRLMLIRSIQFYFAYRIFVETRTAKFYKRILHSSMPAECHLLAIKDVCKVRRKVLTSWACIWWIQYFNKQLINMRIMQNIVRSRGQKPHLFKNKVYMLCHVKSCTGNASHTSSQNNIFTQGKGQVGLGHSHSLLIMLWLGLVLGLMGRLGCVYGLKLNLKINGCRSCPALISHICLSDLQCLSRLSLKQLTLSASTHTVATDSIHPQFSH